MFRTSEEGEKGQISKQVPKFRQSGGFNQQYGFLIHMPMNKYTHTYRERHIYVILQHSKKSLGD